jgi:hypothetical protein
MALEGERASLFSEAKYSKVAEGQAQPGSSALLKSD